MNNRSYLFIAVGVLILGALVYFIMNDGSEPEPQVQNNNRQANNPPAVAEPPPPSFLELVLDYKKDSLAEPKSLRVEEGQKVVIKTTADIEDEVHLHGYDIRVEVKPGVVATLEFTANKTGRFPIELEEIKVDIGVIEVYPK